MGGHSKRQAHVHAARISLDRGIEKLLDLSERHNLVELAFDFAPPHPEQRAVHKDVLATGQLHVKTRANFQQAAHPAVDIGVSRRRLGNARQHPEEGAFPRAVAADDANDFALVNFEIDIAQRPERGRIFIVLTRSPMPNRPQWLRRGADEGLAQCRIFFTHADAVAFRQSLDVYGEITHKNFGFPNSNIGCSPQSTEFTESILKSKIQTISARLCSMRRK